MLMHKGWVCLLGLTVITLSAFAANSLLTRVALGEQFLGAPGFTFLRLASAIVMLRLLLLLTQPKLNVPKLSMTLSLPSMYLSIYAVCFSYAYINLSTGTGAVILFTCVQLCMLLISFISGDRLNGGQWLGALLAFSGFIYLMLPSLGSPSLLGFILMSIAGIAWGLYSVSGSSSNNPVADTYANFLQSWPWLIGLWGLSMYQGLWSWQGALLAIASGALASALGYTLWFVVVKNINIASAALSQLLVPVLASMAGWLFYAERITVTFIIASTLILAGLLLVVLNRSELQSK